jgi:3-dehydroquinate synthase
LSYHLDVTTEQSTYPILIGAGQWSDLADTLQARFKPTKLVLAADETVAELYGATVRQALERVGAPVSLLVCPAGESSKCTDVATDWWQALAALAVDRHSVLVALGGGVVGDLAGFVAATYLRGLPFVQVPTTLLAQVDSSVGGKVAINLPAGKNLVGCFWQPQLVWIDPTVLLTLSSREFSAGLAEVIKYGVLRDDGLMEQLETCSDGILSRHADTLAPLVQRCCQIKADVVQQDPRETTGIRAMLNFGHTVGHAIEKLTGYDTVLHGEAVSMGMVAEARLAEQLGWTAPGLADRLTRVARLYDLPTELPQFPWEQWRAAMLRDKKNVADRIAFALPRRLGCVELTTEVPIEAVQSIVRY